MDRLLIRGEIHTANPAQPQARAMVIEEGVIAFVGTEAGAALYLRGKPHETLDGGGAAVLPGFVDAHMHFVHRVLSDRRVSLRGAGSHGEIKARLGAGLAALQKGQWLIGEGWNQASFPGEGMVMRQTLDGVSDRVPIIAVRACGHILAANGVALALAGIERADGLLRETEQDVLWQQVPKPTAEDTVAAMIQAQYGLYEKGITAVLSDDGSDGILPLLRAIRDAGDEGRLKVRYGEQLNLGNAQLLRDMLSKGLQDVAGERLCISSVKILLDGSLGARTAALSADYGDDPGNRGILLYTQAQVDGLVSLSADYGLPVAIHAIGDGAMDQALTAIERVGKGLCHGIVHAQLTTREQLIRAGRRGVTLIVQPIFLDADVPILKSRISPDLYDTSYRWRTALGMGAHVAFSTDCPVEPYDPFANLYCAMTRRGLGDGEAYLPEEGFTFSEALYAYTEAGTRLLGGATRRGATRRGATRRGGMLKPGRVGDVILLDRPIDEGDPASIRGAKVTYTLIGGEVVFEGRDTLGKG